MLTCSKTGYLLNLELYIGYGPTLGAPHLKKTASPPSDAALSAKISCSDNVQFYTSVLLCEYFLKKQIYMIGTIKKSQKHFPKAIVYHKQQEPLKDGDPRISTVLYVCYF